MRCIVAVCVDDRQKKETRISSTWTGGRSIVLPSAVVELNDVSKLESFESNFDDPQKPATSKLRLAS